ncbi:MAG: sensor histidine kinase, partial [Bacteroidota bacterium]
LYYSMRWGIFLLFLWLCNGCSNPPGETSLQTTAKDSIQIWANTAKNNTKLSLDNRLGLLKQAHLENHQIKNKASQVKNLSRISLAYLGLGDTLNFRKTNTELMTLAKQIGDQVAHGEAHWDLGALLQRSQPDSAFYHFKEAHNLFLNTELEEKNDYPGRMLRAIATVKENSKDYAGAEKDIIAAIELFKKLENKYRLYGGYNTLGDIQTGLNKFDKALEYQLKAKEYIQYAPPDRQARLYLQNQNNIAGIYLYKKDYAQAFELYNQLEEASRKEGNLDLLLQYGYASKAISGFKSGNLSSGEALAFLDKSVTVLDSLGNEYQKARNKQYMAEILWDEKRTEEAIALGVEAKEIAKNTGNNDRLLNVLKFLSQTDSENGAQHAKAYFDLNEQLQLQERTIQDKFARIQMETDEVIEENESLAKRSRLLGGIALGLLVLGIAVFTIISQRISNQRLKFQQKQQESNQEIYGLMLAQHGKMEEGKKSEQKRVSEELHDGILGQMLGIRLVLSGLNERDDPAAVEQRAELIVKLQELEEEIRTISHELNASAYEKVHNFILSLQDLMATVQKSSKIKVDFQPDNQFEWDSLHSDIKINSYRITQELLQNCVKHAQCKNVNVVFQKNKNSLNLTIRDDGVGFDDSKAKKGIGLKNIISRVKKMGAQLEIKSQPTKGTEVIITIPNIDLKRQHPKPKSKRNTVVEV